MSYPYSSIRHYDNRDRREVLWRPVLERPCPFPAQIFLETMHDMILNPNYNTSWILRADILSDSLTSDSNLIEELAPCDLHGDTGSKLQTDTLTHNIEMRGFSPIRTLVRKFIPRNPERDKAANQTCIFFDEDQAPEGLWKKKSLVVYLAHASSAEELPYYLPAVKAVAFLHEENLLLAVEEQKKMSIHYLLFEPSTILTTRLERTALRLMERIIKVGNGNVNGYEKRVHHDLIIPRERYQDSYLKLRLRHAPRLMANWVEKTDPKKHVFEDILIAAFLIELWDDMYDLKNSLVDGSVGFPGFVDIGCGNGVLVDILLKEGYKGYGFDARKRMTWSTFDEETQKSLYEMVLIPWMLVDEMEKVEDLGGIETLGQEKALAEKRGLGEGGSIPGIHNGIFRKGIFIISNHADELTGWTPILAKAANSQFLIIPCCSHNLSGYKHRHKSTKTVSTIENHIGKIEKAARVGTVSSEYASLVEWVASIAEDVGYVVEREVLRIPSTRNIGLIGRICNDGKLSLDEVLGREGGGIGWAKKALTLRKA